MAEERRLVPATPALQASSSQMQDRESQMRALAHRLVEWAQDVNERLTGSEEVLQYLKNLTEANVQQIEQLGEGFRYIGSEWVNRLESELSQEAETRQAIIARINLLASMGSQMQFAIAGHKDVMAQVDAWAQKTEGRCDALEHHLKNSQGILSVV